MSILEAVVLGAVQGLTEFIPVSSSGHLVLVPEALGWREPGLPFDVLLHLASLMALLVYFSGELVDLARGAARGDGRARRLIWLLALGTIPAGVAGLALGDFFERSFGDARGAAVQLVITAVILVGAEMALAYHVRRTSLRGAHLRTIGDLTPADAGVIGVAQAISILPGISRSGATIGAGLSLSIERADAAKFAFLLAIPALVGASAVELDELGSAALGMGAGVAGFIASLITSYAAIFALLRYLKTHSLYPFAIYCAIAGVFFYAIV